MGLNCHKKTWKILKKFVKLGQNHKDMRRCASSRPQLLEALSQIHSEEEANNISEGRKRP